MKTQNLLHQIETAEPRVAVEESSAIERLILKHAMRSFGRRGYAATTLRGIAAEADVTAPMVSYYFKSKEGLFRRVAEIVMESVESEVAEALAVPLPFHEAIEAILRAHVKLIERSPAAVEFMVSLLYGPQEGQPAPDIELMYADTRRLIQETFEKGIATGEFRPRPGVTVSFLVEQLANVVHDYVIRRFRADRLIERHPERQQEIEARCGEMSLEVALELFFFGAGDVPALKKT